MCFSTSWKSLFALDCLSIHLYVSPWNMHDCALSILNTFPACFSQQSGNCWSTLISSSISRPEAGRFSPAAGTKQVPLNYGRASPSSSPFPESHFVLCMIRAALKHSHQIGHPSLPAQPTMKYSTVLPCSLNPGLALCRDHPRACLGPHSCLDHLQYIPSQPITPLYALIWAEAPTLIAGKDVAGSSTGRSPVEAAIYIHTMSIAWKLSFASPAPRVMLCQKVEHLGISWSSC